MADGSVVIDSEINDKGLDKGLKNIKNKMKKFGKELDRIADRDLTAVAKGIEKVNDRLKAMSKLGAAVSIAPTAVPAAASLTGGVLALASAFGAAGVGVAGFGAVAIPTLKEVFDANEELIKAEKELKEADSSEERAEALDKLKEATEGLSDSQKDALETYREFGAFWDEYAEKFQEPVLELFTSSLETLKTLLELSEPVIHEAAEGLNNVMDALNRSLGTDGVKDFFEYLANDAQSSIENFGTIFGNITLGIMNLMEAFSPLSNDMQDGLVGLSEKFANWTSTLSESDEFQKFTDYVRENGPTLIELLGNLGKVFLEIAEAVAPIGEDILEIATALTEDLAEALENNDELSEFAANVTVLAAALAALSPVLMPVIQGLSWILRLFGGIPAMIATGITAFELFKQKVEEIRDQTLVDIGVWFFDMLIKINEFKKNSEDKFEDMKSKVIEKFNYLQENAGEIFGNLALDILSIITGLDRDALIEIGNMVSNGIEKFQELSDTVSNIVSEIEGFFDNMSLEIPEIKLPRLPKISIGTSYKDFFGASIPVPNITWHKTGGVFTRPVIAGNAGFGDVEEGIIPFAGPHAKKIANLIANEMPGGGNALPTLLQLVVDKDVLAEAFYDPISQKINQRIPQSRRRL